MAVEPEEMLKEQGIAADRRIKNTDAKARSSIIKTSVMARTGVARTRITLVAYMDHTKSGSRCQVSPAHASCAR